MIPFNQASRNFPISHFHIFLHSDVWGSDKLGLILHNKSSRKEYLDLQTMHRLSSCLIRDNKKRRQRRLSHGSSTVPNSLKLNWLLSRDLALPFNMSPTRYDHDLAAACYSIPSRPLLSLVCALPRSLACCFHAGGSVCVWPAWKEDTVVESASLPAVACGRGG